MKTAILLVDGVKQESEWRCNGCGQKYAEYVNGCPKCWVDDLPASVNRSLFPNRKVVPTQPEQDRKAVACNYTDGSKIFQKGALCFINRIAGDGESVGIVGRSRGGRWVEKWDRFKRLSNLRLKTIPPPHPLYRNPKLWEIDAEDLYRRLTWQS